MDRATVEKANEDALARLIQSDPVVVDVRPAGEVIPGMTPKTVLHAGPPIEWERMCGPQRGAVIGGLLLEGAAASEEEAAALASSGEITLAPCHEHRSVGPMAGVITSSMPVYVAEDKSRGSFTFCTVNEGRGRSLRYGVTGDDVLDRLRWMGHELAPLLAAAIKHAGGVPIRPILAEALHMNDECHNRYKAASALFAARLSPHLAAVSHDESLLSSVLDFLGGNDYTFLNVAMAGQKAMADAAHGVSGSTMVTALARNGTDFGIRVSGLGEAWFTAPAPYVQALYFPKFGPDDANPDLGDSAIAETVGFGGFAAAASPAIVQFVGGSLQDTIDRTSEMYEIVAGENPNFTIPYLEWRGIPVGIDVLKVVEIGILPALHTAVAHKEAGGGQIGAGMLRAPLDCFVGAFQAFAEQYGLST